MADQMMRQSPIFTSEQLALLDQGRIPSHIAVIPDGNRRWAKQQQEKIEKGHYAGADNLIEIVLAGKALGLKVMTFYLFSTENWSRSKEEVAALMWLLQEFLTKNRQWMIDEGIKISMIGDGSALPDEVIGCVKESVHATRHCNRIDMVLALNYGGRDDIVRAVKAVFETFEGKNLSKEEINEQVIAKHLDTARWADPELLIRTSGEMRLSNFLLWQLSYTEIYFSSVLWPDFGPEDLFEAVVDYQKRERRLGGA